MTGFWPLVAGLPLLTAVSPLAWRWSIVIWPALWLALAAVAAITEPATSDTPGLATTVCLVAAAIAFVSWCAGRAALALWRRLEAD